MGKPQFKAVFRGDGDDYLHVKIGSYSRGKRLDVRHYKGSGPTTNGFNSHVDTLQAVIDALQRAKDDA